MGALALKDARMELKTTKEAKELRRMPRLKVRE